MININVTLLIQMVNFAVLLILMNLILYRPIRRILIQRQQIMEERQAGIDRMNAEVAQSIKEFELKIVEARQSGRAKIQDMKTAAYDEEKAMVQSAADEVAGKLQDVRARIRSEMSKARDQLKGQVEAFSVELAQKILGRSI